MTPAFSDTFKRWQSDPLDDDLSALALSQALRHNELGKVMAELVRLEGAGRVIFVDYLKQCPALLEQLFLTIKNLSREERHPWRTLGASMFWHHEEAARVVASSPRVSYGLTYAAYKITDSILRHYGKYIKAWETFAGQFGGALTKYKNSTRPFIASANSASHQSLAEMQLNCSLETFSYPVELRATAYVTGARVAVDIALVHGLDAIEALSPCFEPIREARSRSLAGVDVIEFFETGLIGPLEEVSRLLEIEMRPRL